MYLFKDCDIIEISSVKYSSSSSPIKFLNAICTNLLNEEKTIFYTCILNPQGRFLMDLFVFIDQKDPSFVICKINKKFTQNFIKLLNVYDIYQEYKVVVRDDLVSFFIPNTNINTKSSDDTLTFLCLQKYLHIFYHININSCKDYIYMDKDPRDQALGQIGVANKNSIDNYSIINDIFDYNQYRILHKVPEGGYDLVPEKSIILEFELENFNAISFTKGCYPGQELMARTKHRGQIRKKLLFIPKSYCLFSYANQDIFQEQEKIDLEIFCKFYNNFINDLSNDKINKNEWYLSKDSVSEVVISSQSDLFCLFVAKFTL